MTTFYFLRHDGSKSSGEPEKNLVYTNYAYKIDKYSTRGYRVASYIKYLINILYFIILYYKFSY